MAGKVIDYRFKIIYAAAMIIILCGHANGGGISVIGEWFPYEGSILTVFMFCSGYFYRSSAEEAVGKYIWKKIRTLIVPLYVYNLIYGIFVQITRLKGFEIGGDFTLYNLTVAPITDGHQFMFNLGGWYVAPLFMVEIYNVLIRKFLKRIVPNVSEWVFFFISLALGICGNQLACLGQGNLRNWWLFLGRMLYFIPFFALGILYKNKLENLDRRIPSRWYFAAIFFIKLAVIYHYGRVPGYTPSWLNGFTEGPVMPIVIGYLLIALYLRVARILEPSIGRSKWVNAIADSTYSIMINHFLGFMTLKTVYALLSRVYAGFSDFDWLSYKTNIWWFYRPRGVYHTLILYVIAGLVVPILIQHFVDRIKTLAAKKKRSQTA